LKKYNRDDLPDQIKELESLTLKGISSSIQRDIDLSEQILLHYESNPDIGPLVKHVRSELQSLLSRKEREELKEQEENERWRKYKEIPIDKRHFDQKQEEEKIDQVKEDQFKKAVGEIEELTEAVKGCLHNF